MSSFTPLASVLTESYEDAFLIEDLVTSRATYLTGEPKAGKSLLTAGIIRALVEGHADFLGQRIHRRVDSVLYLFTDDGADSELKDRLAGTEALEAVTVREFHNASEGDWSDVRAYLAENPVGLVVVDTMLGTLAPSSDIASSSAASQFVSDVRQLTQAGVPVLVVTHTPKGPGEGLSVASSVIGGRALAAGARGVIALRRSIRDGITVETAINRARRNLRFKVEVSSEPGSAVPRWRRSEVAETSPRVRVDWKADLAERVVNEQPTATTFAQLGALYAAEVGKQEGTIRRGLSALVRYEGGTWRRVTETLRAVA